MRKFDIKITIQAKFLKKVEGFGKNMSGHKL
jgi:hypothetical protein